MHITFLYLLSLFYLTSALPVVEPNDGSAYLGIWLDSAATSESSIPGDITIGDTPAAFNQRMNVRASSFQMAQNIPLEAYNWDTGAGGAINATMVESSETDASIFLTVYPYTGLDQVTSADLTALANQVSAYQTSYNRSVFLRYAPEMNGQWMSYGCKPSEFKAQWLALYTIFREIAPDTALVWAPNFGTGYPFSIDWTSVSPEDQALLDTNGNGVLDAGDDPFAPYYPGSEYVDWNGMSLYWKGFAYPYIMNEQLPNTFISDNLNYMSFYQTYCAGANKPCMLGESGSAFHTNDGGLDQVDMQSGWHSQFSTNTSFYTSFPKMKMINLFEHAKVEDLNDMRDFRISFDQQVRTDWLSAAQPLFDSNTLLQASIRLPTAAADAPASNSSAHSNTATESKSAAWRESVQTRLWVLLGLVAICTTGIF